jgi:hypothetical protein
MEMYLGDGGDPRLMWRNVPFVAGLAAAIIAITGCAAAGWALLGSVWKNRRRYNNQ